MDSLFQFAAIFRAQTWAMSGAILKQIKFNSKKVFCLLDELEIIKILENTTHNDDIILAKGSNLTIINILVKYSCNLTIF